MYAGRTYASSVATDDEYYCLDDDASSSSKFYTSGLSYARRPSGTNNHSTVPRLQHRRLSSGSAAGLVHGVPRSAPLMCRPALNGDDDSFSFDSLDDDLLSESSPARHPPLPSRSRNRASLPACFSLLKMHTTATSSPAHTVSRQSPPTPRLPLAQRPASIPPPQAVHATPRGRRREAGASTSMRRADSRARTARPEELHSGASSSPADFPRRGRAPTRRNSSPPPTAALLHASSERTRGRARIAELSPDAPGFGTGRSGLVHRERAAAAGRVAL